MRTTRVLTAAAAAAAAAITLAGCGDDTDPPEESTATSSGQTNDADEEAAAVKASKATIEKGLERNALEPYPESLFTEERIDKKDEQIAEAKKLGDKTSGEVDKVVSMEKSSVTLPRQVAMTVCVERNERWLDKKGNDVRGDQDGEPVKPGSKAELLVRTVPGEKDGTWLIDSISEKGTCS